MSADMLAFPVRLGWCAPRERRGKRAHYFAFDEIDPRLTLCGGPIGTGTYVREAEELRKRGP